MAELIKPAICVIGAGAGGLSVAAAAAAFGVPAVLIEKGRLGGQSLNSGCVPSKALIAAAERAHLLRNGAAFGLKTVRFGIDFAAVRTHVHDVVDALAPNDSYERFSGLGVRVIAGTARFTDPRTVVVGDLTIRAHHFVIATGSSPVVPAIPGLLDTPHLTNETVFELAECPRHLVVIGASAIGLELAQAFRRLGAEVTVLAAAPLLSGDDSECASVVLGALAREGIRLRAGAAIAKVSRSLAKMQVTLATATGAEMVEGSHLLVAVGRRPNVEELDLGAADILYAPHGVVVDERLRTSNKRVYAIGDVTGGPPFTNVANYHAGIVIRHALFRLPERVNHRIIARVTHTDPELAHVGLLEQEARAERGAIRVLRWPYRENDRAQAGRATTGHVKVITDRRGEILGATIVGARAGDNIAAWTLAVGEKMNIRAMAGLVMPHPTYAEVGKRAAITYFARRLTFRRVRRIIRWLRRLR